ncbi:MAG TPA: tetratricopeptide repeat protein, partial [Daejeonella sp.]|nr:tetratricopeptide repeat protein [Daejeonella sp.]
MQNLTARYNILYNARELINESERNIQLAYQDNYEQLLTVYQEPNESLSQPELKKLDEVIRKAQVLINEKSQSRYVPDAYFLMARANHLKSNFFNAAEFFNYISKAYPNSNEIKQAALAYKSRSLIQLKLYQEAQSSLDTAFKYLNTEKKSVADLYATQAQLFINAQQYKQAAGLLEEAIKLSKNKQHKLRWTYLLAQLQQLSGKNQEASANFNLVARSNAPYILIFNASLNRINIQEEENKNAIEHRINLLTSLLRDDKNRDLTDLIYFQIGRTYEQQHQTDKAIENYNQALRKNTGNNNQKGLVYLGLAELYFKQKDYVKSKAYYDSTLIALSPQHPDYERIQKKGSNLDLLASRLSIIDRQDTLQMLASLPETDRESRINALINRVAQKTTSNATSSNQQAFETIQGSKFYFHNATALSQGLIDFKKKWGNRKLEDNWRFSRHSVADMTNAEANFPEPGNTVPFAPVSNPGTANLKQELLAEIPVTPEQRLASDQKIAVAYYEIGNYYREVLQEDAQAIAYYERLLNRFPNTDLKLPTYYNLYRLYAQSNPQKSAEYKNILLSQYGDTPFAKIISDPDYSQKMDIREIALHKAYNEIYDNYTRKNYPEVLKKVAEAEIAFGKNNLSAQLAYLNALALGRQFKLHVLENAFKQIITDFPQDQLIVPLVQQHLTYIEANRNFINGRIFALVDQDQREPHFAFVEEPRQENVKTESSKETKMANSSMLLSDKKDEKAPDLASTEDGF